MTSRAELVAAVAAVPAGGLLPPRRSGDPVAATQVALVDVFPLVPATSRDDLGPGPWVVVAHASDGSWVGIPLVADSHVPLRVRRAAPGDGTAATLLERVVNPGPLPFAQGDFVLISLDAGALPPCGAPGEHGFAVDQTHDSVVVDGAAVVKWAVHLSPREGDPPAARLLTQLSAVGFTEIPAPLGLLQWRGPRQVGDGGTVQRTLLASVTAYLPGARDGWDWYVQDLVDHLAGGLSCDSAVEPARTMGGLVARLHVALATRTRDNPYPVRRSTPTDAWAWRDDALATLQEALTTTTGEPGRRLAARAAAARRALDGIGDVVRTPVSLVHGDLHVGQVLRWDGGYVVNDFDGNPVLSPERQAALQPPARDVAGMLQSLDHVGRIVDRRTGGGDRDAVEGWIVATREAFLASYRAELAAAGRAELLDERLLLAFEVEQECREYVYAARHLPHWVHVADAAMAALLPEGD